MDFTECLRHAVALSEGGDVGSQQKGCEDNLFLFRCHCHNLFSFLCLRVGYSLRRLILF